MPQPSDVSSTRGDLEPHQIGREREWWPGLPGDDPCLDMEIHWQDLFAIMQPEVKYIPLHLAIKQLRLHDDKGSWDSSCILSLQNKDLHMMTLTSLDVGSEALHQHCSDTEANPVHLMETPLQHRTFNGTQLDPKDEWPVHTHFLTQPLKNLRTDVWIWW